LQPFVVWNDPQIDQDFRVLFFVVYLEFYAHDWWWVIFSVAAFERTGVE